MQKLVSHIPDDFKYEKHFQFEDNLKYEDKLKKINSTKPKIPIQTYQAKATKANIPNRTKHNKPRQQSKIIEMEFISPIGKSKPC